MTRHTCRVGVPTHSDTHSCLMRSRDAAKTKMRLGSPSPLLNCSTDRAHLGSLVPNWTDRSGFAREYRVTLHTCSTQRVVHALHPTPAALHFWRVFIFFSNSHTPPHTKVTFCCVLALWPCLSCLMSRATSWRGNRNQSPSHAQRPVGGWPRTGCPPLAPATLGTGRRQPSIAAQHAHAAARGGCKERGTAPSPARARPVHPGSVSSLSPCCDTRCSGGEW